MFESIHAITLGGNDRADLVEETLDEVARKLRRELRLQGIEERFEVVLHRGDEPGTRYLFPVGIRDFQPSLNMDLDRACEGCGIRLGIRFPDATALGMLTRLPTLSFLSLALLAVLLGALVATALGLRRLQAQSRAQVAFVNNLAHETKTPLYAMAVAARILSEDPAVGGDARRSATLESIQRSVQRLQSRVERLLDVQALEAGATVVRKERWIW